MNHCDGRLSPRVASSPRVYVDRGVSAWFKTTSLALFLILSSAGCGDRGATDARSASRDTTVAPSWPPSPIAYDVDSPLQIVPGKRPVPGIGSLHLAKSVALVVHEAMPYIAQARYCWPSFRFRGSVQPVEQRLADYALMNADMSLPPRCTSEPAAVTALFTGPPPFSRGPTAPPSRMESFLALIGYTYSASEGCNPSRHEAGQELRRQWRSDVRIQRSGDPAVDGAFATILADPRFQAAMGTIKVALVSDSPNVLIVQHLLDICIETKNAACNVAHQPPACLRGPVDLARESLARRATGGRTGYFPNANEFARDYPIGPGMEGFTLGDGRTIDGAVCVGLAYPIYETPGRGLVAEEQAAAAACLLRALGVAGMQPTTAAFANRHRPLVLKLVGFDADRAVLYDTAFSVIRSIYRTGEESS